LNGEVERRTQVEQALSVKLKEASTKLESSESQKRELEFLYEETNAKLSELTLKIDEKTKEVIGLRQNQTERQTDIEFAYEEQKVSVQELETKLNAKCDDFKRVNCCITQNDFPITQAKMALSHRVFIT
jgi:TolA-binding protein